MNGFYNRGREGLLSGTNWAFKSNRYIFVIKGLKQMVFISGEVKKKVKLSLFTLWRHTG